MKSCFSYIALLLTATSAAAENVCESCHCEPEYEPQTVSCACETPDKVLDFTSRDFEVNFKNTLNFTVSNCGKIVFKQNLFRELQKLDNLKIQNVKDVRFEIGVFQSLNHLRLRNIKELSFKSNAFHGGQMKSVEIRQSNIGDLPRYAFHDVNSLDKFVLSDVHIHSVQPGAIMLKDNKAVEIVNATMDEIASNAITIEANYVVIFNSALRNMKPVSINVTAKDQFIISHTEFDENMPDNPITAMAPVVNISNNHFQHLKPQIIKNLTGNLDGNIIFIHNTIDTFDSHKPLNLPSSNWNIQGNQFKCSCEMFGLFENLKNSNILDNNYCMLSKCRVSLRQGKEKCERQSPANLDDTDLCKTVPTVAPLRPRDGRVLGLTTQEKTQFTTHMPLSLTTPKSSASIHLLSAILFWTLIALKLL
ncbi:hypothetical protein L9F63_007339 [Diploptera punctata]|uniref:Uncharacterized protein n=1 Tax=Diploptera punctata TaxID=6984 RepID=A0AAD7Z989_DIPPU|nr:hypothetical protein L9F63_007339 [Diploptera punctata]